MMQPYEVHLDHASALRLAESGATVLVLAVPEGTVVLVDHQVVSPAQQGLADYYSSLSEAEGNLLYVVLLLIGSRF